MLLSKYLERDMLEGFLFYMDKLLADQTFAAA